jgi:hypothetical protein
MGNFIERSPSGKKEKKGASKPWPRLARVRVSWGPALAPPLAAALLLPLAAALGLPWWRGKVHPSPLYKGGSLEEKMHNTIHDPLHLAALILPWCASHTLASALSLSHSRVASRRVA